MKLIAHMFNSTRKMLNQPERFSIAQIFGAVMVITGVTAIVGCGFYECFTTNPNPSQSGISSVISIGFLVTILGMAFFFPDMLKSGAMGTTSTLRIAVFMIVAVFTFLCVKIGWTCKSFSEFKIDSTWAYILGLAFGAKTAQSFSETKTITSNASNETTAQADFSQSIPLHDLSTIGNPPPAIAPAQVLK